MMAVENAAAIADALVAGGRDGGTPVAVLCDGTMPGERTVLATLGTLGDGSWPSTAYARRRSSWSARWCAVAHPRHFS